MIQDLYFLSSSLNLSGDYIEKMTWRMRKELIEYHKMVMEESKLRK